MKKLTLLGTQAHFRHPPTREPNWVTQTIQVNCTTESEKTHTAPPTRFDRAEEATLADAPLTHGDCYGWPRTARTERLHPPERSRKLASMRDRFAVRAKFDIWLLRADQLVDEAEEATVENASRSHSLLCLVGCATQHPFSFGWCCLSSSLSYWLVLFSPSACLWVVLLFLLFRRTTDNKATDNRQETTHNTNNISNRQQTTTQRPTIVIFIEARSIGLTIMNFSFLWSEVSRIGTVLWPTLPLKYQSLSKLFRCPR